MGFLKGILGGMGFVVGILVVFVIVLALIFGGSDNSKSSGSSGVDSSKYILWDYSGTLYDKISYSEARTRRTFMVVKLDLKNHGYDEFSVSPADYSAVVDGIEYDYSSATYSLGNMGLTPLESVKLRDGTETSGYIAFEIPKGKTSFEIEYTGFSWDDYNFVRKS